MDKKLNFLIDECLPISVQEFISGEYIHSTELLPRGTPDETVLEKARKLGLVVITIDVRFVLETINKNQDIIYQNRKGERHYIRSNIFSTNCSQKSIKKETKYLLENDLIIIP